MNVLFVCLGNICRSPLAEAFLKRKYQDHNIESRVDSAGFESFNINEPPDEKANELAKTYGISLEGKARLFLKSDFDNFDKIYVMDMQSYTDIRDLARSDDDLEKVDYLMHLLHPKKKGPIADPFIQGGKDSSKILSLIDQATDEILKMAKKKI